MAESRFASVRGVLRERSSLPAAAVPVPTGPRVRLFVPSRGWGGRRRREILLAAGMIAVVFHVLLVAAILEAPRLWPVPPVPPPSAASEPPTIDMVMDDAKVAGGARPTPPATPSPPAPRTPPAPQTRATEETPPAPRDPDAPADLPPTPAETPPPPAEAAQPDVQLDPSSGLGYGRQDNPEDIPASPDDRHANKVPAYPRAAGMRGEEGTVEVLVRIAANGAVTGAEIAVSSGHPDLDRTAQRAIENWHFHPAMQNGVAVPTQSMQVFNFHIIR